MRRLVVACSMIALAGAIATTAMAAAPRLILVDQGGLERPIVLTDWGNNGTFLVEWHRARPASNERIRSRPSYRISFMWGPFWSDFVPTKKALRALRASDTDVHGRFWPAWRSRPAVVDLGHGVFVGLRQATPTQLRILRRVGVPVRVDG